MTGLEPATSGVTGRRSNQLSYIRTWTRVKREGRLIGPSRNRVNERDVIRRIQSRPTFDFCEFPALGS